MSELSDGLRRLSAWMKDRDLDMQAPKGIDDPEDAADALDANEREIALLKRREYAYEKMADHAMALDAEIANLIAERDEARDDASNMRGDRFDLGEEVMKLTAERDAAWNEAIEAAAKACEALDHPRDYADEFAFYVRELKR